MKIDVAQEALLGGSAATSRKDSETRRNVWLREFESAMLRRDDSPSSDARTERADTPPTPRRAPQDLPREPDGMAPGPGAVTCEAAEGWDGAVQSYGSHALRAPSEGTPNASAPLRPALSSRAGDTTDEADAQHVPVPTGQPDLPTTGAAVAGSPNAAVDAAPALHEPRSAAMLRTPLAPPVAVQRMHLTRHGDGADLWIRDARLPGSRVAELVHRTLQAMRASGLRIYHAAVNGKPVFAEPYDDGSERRHEADGFARDASFSNLETRLMHRDPWFTPRRRYWP